MTPAKELPLTVKAGVQGCAGRRRSASGSCSLACEF